MAAVSCFQGSQKRASLLAHGRQVAAYTEEVLSPSRGPETPRDLLLHLDHPNVALALVVIERDAEVVHEGSPAKYILGSRGLGRPLARERRYTSP